MTGERQAQTPKDASLSSDVIRPAPRERPALRRVWLLVVVTPLLLFALTCVVVVNVVRRAGGDESVIGPELSRLFPWIAIVNHSLLFVLTCWLARRDGLTLGDLGWRQEHPAWITECAVGLFAGGVIYFVQTFGMEPLTRVLQEVLQSGALRPSTTPSLTFSFVGLLAGTFFAGVVEETVFRGYIQRQLSQAYGDVMGILLATSVFTVGLHWGFGPWGLSVVFVNGLLLAGLYHWRRNLLSCAIAHALVNALVVSF